MIAGNAITGYAIASPDSSSLAIVAGYTIAGYAIAGYAISGDVIAGNAITGIGQGVP